jgi:Pvc16 N-terminal domain
VPDYQAVFAVGDALAKYLTNAYDPVSMGFPCTFKLVSSAEIANEDTTKLDKTVSLYLHRITTAEHYRNVTRLQDSPNDQPVLYLDLHYMLSYWDALAEGAEAEQKILTWTMQTLQSNQIIDTSVLGLSSSAPGWAAGDSVQLIPADLSMQDILDIWNSLGPNYRLSVGYVVRVVRVDRTIVPGVPVVATRFGIQNGVSP